MEKIYDAIIIGARCAGSPTAMLLARKGYKVLMLDKAAFPSDTISTHIILTPGVERLKKWGLLDKVLATNTPVIQKMGLDLGPFALIGNPPIPKDIPGLIAPRRIVLDKILVDAAVEAGVEFRENCHVEEIIMDGEKVSGVRCSTKAGATVIEKARIVIGADGRNSILARAVKAKEYNSLPALTCWYYTYWSGLPVNDLVMHTRPNRAMGAIPTNDGLVCLPVAWTASEFKEYRSDIEGNYMKSLGLVEELADLVSQGKREDRFSGMADLPNFFRNSFGPGWALVGDAAYHKDPITGQGIMDAFKGAESLSEALDAGWSGKESLEAALSKYVKDRDEEAMPNYSFTCDFAKLQEPPPDMQYLFSVLRDNQAETNRFLGTMAGSVKITEFFSPENINQIIGPTLEKNSK